MNENDEERRRRKEEALVLALFCFAWAFLVAVFAMLGGCSTTVAPNLKLPEKQCQTLAMPPFPQRAVIRIDGDTVDADEGGQVILRYYAAARRVLK